MSHNIATNQPVFVDRHGFDYRLKPGGPAIDAGIDPGMANAFNLTPVAQYLHKANEEPRHPVGQIDVGAYEYQPRRH